MSNDHEAPPQTCKFCQSPIQKTGGGWADFSGCHEYKCMLSRETSRHEPAEPQPVSAEPEKQEQRTLSDLELAQLLAATKAENDDDPTEASAAALCALTELAGLRESREGLVKVLSAYRSDHYVRGSSMSCATSPLWPDYTCEKCRRTDVVLVNAAPAAKTEEGK